MAASTEGVEADTVFLRFDEFGETRSQFRILSIRQATLKYTILHPLPVGLQDAVDFRAALVFGDIVRYNNVHRCEWGMGDGENARLRLVTCDFDQYCIKGGYLSVSPIRYFAKSRA